MSEPVTAESLTDEQIRAHRPSAYSGEIACTENELLDCYRADGSLRTDPEFRHAARARIAAAINARREGGKQ